MATRDSNAVRTKYGSDVSVDLDDANEIELTIEQGAWDGAQATITADEADRIAELLSAAAAQARKPRAESGGES